MLHSVIETPDFLRDAENSGLTAEERGRIVSLTAAFQRPARTFLEPAGPEKSGSPAGARAKAEVIA
jgi:hypothetical protein